jgi:tRNA pseudouridine38-40 synthase
MRLRAVIEYDGTGYQGWQSQSGRGPTVQEALEHALGVVLRQKVQVVAAGRTDAGVHARGQVVAFDARDDLASVVPGAPVADEAAPELLLRAVNALLPDAIALRVLAVATPDFDPRRDARLRAYRYRIWNGRVRSPFEARTSWHVREPLDDRAMHQAATELVGEHDFASFQGADKVSRPSVRRVERSAVERAGDVVTYAIEGNAFARHMVRNIVGELVAIGRGRREPGAIDRLLAARDRRLAAPTAPPQGLFLEWVRYGETG